MLDNPQDALRLAKDRQQNFRNTVEIDRIFRPISNEQQPIISQEWKRTLLNLPKVRIEFTLLVQKR